jgi:hypothetical protein
MQGGIQSWTGGTFLGACRQVTVVGQGVNGTTLGRVSDHLTCSIQCFSFEVTQSFHFERDIRRWRIMRRGNIWQMSCPTGQSGIEPSERLVGGAHEKNL